MGWVKSTAELHLDALGNGALACVAPGDAAWQPGGREQPPQHAHSCLHEPGWGHRAPLVALALSYL